MKYSLKNNLQQRIVNMRTIGTLLVCALTLPLITFSQHTNPAPVDLLTAGNFRALAGTALTNGAASTITGDAGGTSVTNNGVITGSIYTAGGVVTTALADLATVIADVSVRSADEALGVELGGLTLGRGIYSSGTFGINGTLTLNGSASDIFIFQASTTLITGVTCNVLLTGGAVWSNVFWQLGSSATIDGTFKGVILANTAITQNTGTIEGRTLARDAGVTLTGTSTLPVELSTFTATAHRAGSLLQWSTATEVNNYGFEIERTDVSRQSSVISWNKLGFVEGSGTTNAPKQYSFSDESLLEGKYSYRLKQIDRDGKFEYSQAVEVTITGAPKEYALMNNFPNPFNPSTMIHYSLANTAKVSLKVYNVIGEEVADLVNSSQEAGNYSVPFTASSGSGILTSGVYFYRLQSGAFVETKKMLLMK
ncbi:MAG: ice-binding family protein [Bacteroidota bacterium]